MEEMPSDQLQEPTAIHKRCCVLCNATKTPLWRSGPAGPRSLCNACGIKYRKRRNLMAMNKSSKVIEKHRKQTSEVAAAAETSASTSSDQGGDGGLVPVGRFLIQRQRSLRRRRSMKLGEEEQAAFLLMQLSFGSVFA